MATAIIKSDGDRIDYTPSGNVSAGDVVVLAGRLCIASEDIAANVLGSLLVFGIVTLPKAAPLAIAVGDTIYWHAAGPYINKTSGSADATLTALFAAASGDTTIDVRLT
jgi:predicted RecA/RadA family phage recombinase